MKNEFLNYLKDALEQNLFVKLTLGKYRGKEKDLENLYAEPVKIGDEILLSFRYKLKTKDIYKNLDFESVPTTIDSILGRDFLFGALYTTENDVIIEYNKKRKAKLFKKKASFTKITVKSHNKVKSGIISSKEKFLNLLGITNISGEIRAGGYDKFRQVEKFIEILDSLYKESDLSKKKHLKIVDFGSGKSYLTFALYNYFEKSVRIDVNVTGVEQREELVKLCNNAAVECKFTGLKFTNNSILNYQISDADIVVALHACDTATDDAIASAIAANAGIIILAPCCHKYVRKKMSLPGNLKSVFGHGIIEEHVSSFVTDGLRSLMLEAHGYKTKVFEFISHEHTSKNIMITAVKDHSAKGRSEMKLKEIEIVKSDFGLKDFYLDKMLDMAKIYSSNLKEAN